MGIPTVTVLVLVTVITFTLLSLVPSSLGTKQEVTFFENWDCTGEQVTYEESAGGLNNSWVGSNAASVRIVGIWTFTLTSTVNFVTHLGVGQPPAGPCVLKERMIANANTSVFTAIARIGPSEMSLNGSSIYLSNGVDFNGNYSVYHYTSGDVRGNSTFEIPMKMKSWAIFGAGSWVTFTNDSTVVPNCLRKAHGTDGFTLNPWTSIVVKMFRPAESYECGGSGTTNRPGTSSKPGSTTPGSASTAMASLTLITLISSAVFVSNY